MLRNLYKFILTVPVALSHGWLLLIQLIYKIIDQAVLHKIFPYSLTKKKIDFCEGLLNKLGNIYKQAIENRQKSINNIGLPQFFLFSIPNSNKILQFIYQLSHLSLFIFSIFLLIIQKRMYVPSSPKYSPFRQQSRQMQVLRSIQTKTDASSQSKNQQMEQLMVKLLMLAIEIDRKDTIIRELMMAANNSEHEIAYQQMRMRNEKYVMEIKTLRETVQMLKENILTTQSSKSKEVFASINHQFNEELEKKIQSLQAKLRDVEDQNIGFREQLRQNNLNQSMAEYKMIQASQNQKGKVRQLQSLLISQRSKVESERKAVTQKSYIIEDLKQRLIQQQSNEKILIQQYEQKIRTFHNQLHYHQSLKKSQIVSNQQRINASSQQITRLAQQIRYLKTQLQSQRQNLRNKERDLTKIMNESKQFEAKYLKLEGDTRQITAKYESKVQQMRYMQKELSEKSNQLKRKISEADQFRFIMTSKKEEVGIHFEEINRLKEQVRQLYHQNDAQKLEIRKLKRKPIGQAILCESCRIRETGSSSTLIASQKSIRALNFQQIIQQTQQLIRSNQKIENLINKHDPQYESSIQVYTQNHY